MESETYTAEKVSDEDDELPRCDTRAGIEFFELARLAICVENEEFASACKVGVAWEIVVNIDIAGEVEIWGLFFESGSCDWRREGLRFHGGRGGIGCVGGGSGFVR